MWDNSTLNHLQALMLILVLYMVCTTIFLLNVFLAVVSTAYSSMIRDTVQIRAKQVALQS